MPSRLTGRGPAAVDLTFERIDLAEAQLGLAEHALRLTGGSLAAAAAGLYGLALLAPVELLDALQQRCERVLLRRLGPGRGRRLGRGRGRRLGRGDLG